MRELEFLLNSSYSFRRSKTARNDLEATAVRSCRKILLPCSGVRHNINNKVCFFRAFGSQVFGRRAAASMVKHFANKIYFG